MYNPDKDEPKTVEDYIVYAETFLSGDAGWRSEDVREFLLEFKAKVEEEYRSKDSLWVSHFGHI